MRLLPNVKLTDAGFTLVEFCLAFLILAIGLLALLQTVNVAIRHNLATLIRNEATALADEQMVALKTAVIDTTTFTAVASSASSTDRLSRNFFCNYSVVTAVSTPVPNGTTKAVEIRIAWRYKEVKNSHAVSSFIVNPDL